MVLASPSGGWEHRRCFHNREQISFAWLRAAAVSASLLDIDLTHPFLLTNNLDLMA